MTLLCLSYGPLDVDPKLTYEEKPAKTLDRKDKVLRNNIVLLVKMLWHNQILEEAIKEIEVGMQKKKSKVVLSFTDETFISWRDYYIPNFQ